MRASVSKISCIKEVWNNIYLNTQFLSEKSFLFTLSKTFPICWNEKKYSPQIKRTTNITRASVSKISCFSDQFKDSNDCPWHTNCINIWNYQHDKEGEIGCQCFWWPGTLFMNKWLYICFLKKRCYKGDGFIRYFLKRKEKK